MNALFSCVLNASYYFFELRRNWCGTGIASATPFFAPNLIMGVWRPICSCLPHYSRKGHTWYAYLPACDVPIISQFRYIQIDEEIGGESQVNSLVSTEPIIVMYKNIIYNINILTGTEFSLSLLILIFSSIFITPILLLLTTSYLLI